VGKYYEKNSTLIAGELESSFSLTTVESILLILLSNGLNHSSSTRKTQVFTNDMNTFLSKQANIIRKNM